MLKLDRIEDVIAGDVWRYTTRDGQSVDAQIEVGRPQPIPGDSNGDWYCAVFVETFTDRVVPSYGVGPVDALMNAMRLVQTFADELGTFTPRAAENDDGSGGSGSVT